MTTITLDYVLARARRCASYSKFQQNYFKLYRWAKANGHIAIIERILPPMSYSERGRLSSESRRYTDSELMSDAKLYSTRLSWRRSGEEKRKVGAFSPYGAAIKRGREFMRLCCGHMKPTERGGWSKWTDEALIASATKYQHPGDWKRSKDRLDRAAYQAARLRRDVFLRATAHMTPAANPYAGDYIVYAHEFSDRRVYVGLTFREISRRTEHEQNGPVLEHMRVCAEVNYKVVQQNIATPMLARLAEHEWQNRYIAEGWTPLWTAKAGSLGTVRAIKWTKESVIAEAKKFQSKQEWIDNSQFTYRLAKREGWFNEASAHMPARVLGVGLGTKRSVETCQKLQKAAQRRAADPAWRKAHSRALKGRKLTQAHRDAIGRGVKTVNS